MEVSFHIKIAGGKLMSKGLYVIYNRTEVPRRTFDHRGLTIIPIHTRKATDEEIKEEYARFDRVRFIHYAHFEGLWNDELKYSLDPEHFKKLLKIREHFHWCFCDPNFKVTGEEFKKIAKNQLLALARKRAGVNI